MRYTFLWFILLSFSVFGQTGLIENFNDNVLDAGWKSVPSSVFSLTEENEELKVTANNAGPGWNNLEFSFRPQNISANPVIQLKIRNLQSFSLRIDIVDANGQSNNSQPLSRTIAASNDYVNHVLDFSSNLGSVNATQIAKIVIFVNPGQSPGYTGTFYIDDLIIGDALPYMTSGPIRINQVGYELRGPKTAILEQSAATFPVTIFELLNEQNQVVYTGALENNGAVPGWTGRYFWTADFSAYNQPGTYTVKIGSMQSHTFEIQENLLFNTTVQDAINFFTGMRSTHNSDRALPFHGARTGTANVYGGWWDANGDPGKHMSHLSYANYFNPQQIPMVVWSLLKSLELSEASFGNYSSTVLEEAAWGADYLLRNLDPEGYFYIAIFDDWGNAPSSRAICEWGAPGNNAARSANYQAAFREGGGLAIAALARAYTMNLDAGDSSITQYLNGAVKAYAHLTSPGNGYASKNLEYANNHEENIIDDYCALLASVELYKATGGSDYLADAQYRVQRLLNRLSPEGWLKSDEAGIRPFYHAADEGMPMVALVSYMDIDQSLNAEIADFLTKSVSWYREISEEIENPFNYLRQYQRAFSSNTYGEFKKAFFVPHNNETGYWWQGENARIASLSTAFLMAARKLDAAYEPGTDAMTMYALNQLDWILGKNPFEICMLYGYGYKNYPDYPSGAGMPNIRGGICNGISADDDNENNLAWKPFADNNWQNWRWIEQWLPHNAWYVLAVSTLNNLNVTQPDAISKFGTVTASPQGNHIFIDWATLSENNGSHFEIQRSINGSEFVTIDQVPATGSTGTNTSYSYIDEEENLPQTTSYRIVLVDHYSNRLNSEVAILLVTSMNREHFHSVIARPNPFMGSTRLDIEQPAFRNATLRIVDISGKPVKQVEVGSHSMIMIGEELEPGVYFVELRNSTAQLNGRIIKAR